MTLWLSYTKDLRNCILLAILPFKLRHRLRHKKLLVMYIAYLKQKKELLTARRNRVLVKAEPTPSVSFFLFLNFFFFIFYLFIFFGCYNSLYCSCTGRVLLKQSDTFFCLAFVLAAFLFSPTNFSFILFYFFCLVIFNFSHFFFPGQTFFF